jgi:site-specific DNA-methyltransferase (adenine-specific)
MNSVVHNTDCLEAMRQMPDKAFDLAIVDPPYGIGAGEMRMNNTNHEFKPWDCQPPSVEYFEELRRVSVNQIIWGGNHFTLPETRCFVIWDKKQPEGVSFAMAEYAWTSFDSVPKVFYQFPSHVTQGRKIHPTQKPIELYRWLLTNYAKPGQTILDTHLGSGSSRIAAYDLGFDFTGYELDKDYFDAQEKRFADHIAQPKLFSPQEPQPIQEVMFAAA